MIFTDGNEQQFRRYRLWDIHYAKSDSTRDPYPEAWADRHVIALINRIGLPRRWQLQLFRGSAVKPPVEFGHAVDLE